MVHRLFNPLKTGSFFIFGARGVGKTTYLKDKFKKKSVLIDLLDDEQFDLYLTHTKRLELLCEQKSYEWIIIDEVQRIPSLLNTVHRLIEQKKQKFILTGSSSRKLKRKGANLLGGRAFIYSLHPFCYSEIKDKFNLEFQLAWGSLPKMLELNTDRERTSFLRSYVQTYLKAEIIEEQAVRNLEPFREFLQISAQMSGKIITFSKIAREVGVQIQTVQNYYSILEETYLGFYLPHFHMSIRKSQIEAPKFYLFDNGVKRSLDQTIDLVPKPSTGVYGELFEAFIIQEIFRLNLYYEKDYRLSYFHTKHGAEIDLILSKGSRVIAIEIKSSKQIDEIEVNKMKEIVADLGSDCRSFYLSQDPQEFQIGKISCLNWKQFLTQFAALI